MAGLIKDTVTGYSDTLAVDSSSNIPAGLPASKMGGDLYIGALTFNITPTSYTSVFGNGFFIGSTVQAAGTACNGVQICPAGITAPDAYIIDVKLDDGLPQTGMVRELYRGSGGTSAYEYGAFNDTAGTTARACHHNTNIYDTNGAYPGGTGPTYKDCALIFGNAF